MDIIFILIILVIQISYVSLFTLRMIFMIKGRKNLAALISVIEVTINIIALSLVLDRLSNPIYLLAYSLGYGVGILVGSKIEEILALGHVTVQVITQNVESNISVKLRERGYGVTSWPAKGRDGDRLVLHVLTKRRNMKILVQTINEIDSRAFVISHEPIFFQGGFWAKRIGT
ncbi:MAG: DUF2179 domain-containing protein [Vulcanibacillus sp.]